MAVSRHVLIAEKFLSSVRGLIGRRGRDAVAAEAFAGGLSRELALELFESQLTSRLMDLEARAMKARDEGYYTIGSSGHEANACVAAALRPTDLCFLHYRSGPFMVQRSRQVPGVTPIFDTLLSLSASADDPASGGRHKVWGSSVLNVPPQTSTIASHLPKAVGAAVALDRAEVVGHELPVPDDSIVACSFGDASLNHSTAVGAVNAALWATHQRIPVPLLLVCEDNGIGISVKTPDDWVETQYRHRPGLRYFRGDGRDLVSSWRAARDAVAWCRDRRMPAFLHLKTIRLMGHAGSDVELTYRSPEELDRVEALDPLLAIAVWLVEQGWITAEQILALQHELQERIEAASAEAARRMKLVTTEEIMAPLAPFDAELVAAEASRPAPESARLEAFGGADRLPERQRPRHLAMLLNWALHDLMAQYDEMLLFGEDVSKKGGVYHVSTGLYEKFGVGRVFNTLLDEQTILGLAMGAGHLGYLPCPEIQYLAYLVHASDQLRGEACSLQFFSNDTFRNPMVVRVAGLAYQKGFGGHFHNDNGFAFLREIPGLVLAVPSRGDDAVGMLRTSFALAKACGRVVVFLEPIALYMTKDLHEPNDGGWLCEYPAPGEAVPLGEARVYPGARGDEVLTIITYGNGVPMSLRVAKRLAGEGIGVRVVDLRWLIPLDRAAIAREGAATGRVLVVDEGRESAGVGEQIVTVLTEDAPAPLAIRRVTGRDSYVPLAAAANLVLVDEADVERAARSLASLGARTA